MVGSIGGQAEDALDHAKNQASTGDSGRVGRVGRKAEAELQLFLEQLDFDLSTWLDRDPEIQEVKQLDVLDEFPL